MGGGITLETIRVINFAFGLIFLLPRPQRATEAAAGSTNTAGVGPAVEVGDAGGSKLARLRLFSFCHGHHARPNWRGG